MARKQTLDAIIQLYKKLGGNTSEVLGTKTNINFLGKGKTPEPILEMDINAEALGVMPQSKAIEELTNSVGYALSGKLNDIQANKLLDNMSKMDNFYNPPQVSNITDLATGAKNLDQEGLMSLREAESMSYYNRPGFKVPKGMDPEDLREIAPDDLPPPGSRGGPDDIAAPVEQGFAGFERTIRELAKSDPELAKQFRTVMTNKGDVPAKRSSAREFLLEALKKDEYDVGTPAFGKVNLNNVISAEDVKYITEGGGGIGGDPILLVEKYFGPRIAEALPAGATGDEIIRFTNRVLEKVTDSAGLKPDNPKFDRMTAKFIDEMAEGGRAGFKFGRSAGKAFGLAKKIANINKSVDEGTQMGYGALREYGLEAKDITRLFKEIAMDKTMVGAEKTEYFKMLNQVLKNPDDFPDGIIEIKKRLGMDFARGGLAKILEV